jgi:hypothetical protein
MPADGGLRRVRPLYHDVGHERWRSGCMAENEQAGPAVCLACRVGHPVPHVGGCRILHRVVCCTHAAITQWRFLITYARPPVSGSMHPPHVPTPSRIPVTNGGMDGTADANTPPGRSCSPTAAHEIPPVRATPSRHSPDARRETRDSFHDHLRCPQETCRSRESSQHSSVRSSGSQRSARHSRNLTTMAP